jgi:ketosteroid isomerase-like protein
MLEENVEIVKRGYVAFREAWDANDRGPYEAWVREITSPDFEYVPSGDLPGAATGRLDLDGFLGFLEAFWGEFEVLSAEPSEIVDAGDSVVASVAFLGRGRRSGVEVGIDEFHVWTFRDGKAVRGRAFTSRAKALEAAGCRGSA